MYMKMACMFGPVGYWNATIMYVVNECLKIEGCKRPDWAVLF